MPDCDESLKPFVGRRFLNLEQAVECYRLYAGAAGFDMRHSTRHSRRGTVVTKHILCNKEGFRAASRSTGQRKRLTSRVGCVAKVVFKFIGGAGYVVSQFEERHTHNLLHDSSRQFLKSNRKLDYGHQKFILSCSRASLGASSAHRVFKELVGDYANVGGLASDFKNFKRDMMAYISGADAQMVIDKFYQQKEICNAFFFEYDMDDSQQLSRLFWADPTSRKNYAAFGDVVAFDSTYRTNRYLYCHEHFIILKRILCW